MVHGKCNVLGRDVVFVPEFCWEKEEFSPKTEGDLGLSTGGNEKTGLDLNRHNTANI